MHVWKCKCREVEAGKKIIARNEKERQLGWWFLAGGNKEQKRGVNEGGNNNEGKNKKMTATFLFGVMDRWKALAE